MPDDIESNIYRLREAEYPLTTEQTSEPPTAAATVKAKKAPTQPKPRRSKKDPEPEYSELVRNDHRKKKETSERSRQACDRCRIRKMRCLVGSDTAPCFQCLQDHKECFVTDRGTNQTFKRGEPGRMKRKITELEEEVTGLQEKVRKLEDQVTGFEAAFEISIAHETHLMAKVVHLEEKHVALLSGNFGWRDDMRIPSPIWGEEPF
ncbi:hypothetical protein N7513_012820 [Penicillium frequentans]|nr:hypothetical protein N7513_012820 [Penicillium glabrum]